MVGASAAPPGHASACDWSDDLAAAGELPRGEMPKTATTTRGRRATRRRWATSQEREWRTNERCLLSSLANRELAGQQRRGLRPCSSIESAAIVVEGRLLESSTHLHWPISDGGEHRGQRTPTDRERRSDGPVSRRSVFLVKQLARAARHQFSQHRSGAGGVYTERSPRCLVNAQPPSRLVAHRPLDSIRLTVSEHAPRMRPPGRAMTDPKSGKSDRPGNACKGDDDPVLTLRAGTADASSSGLGVAIVSSVVDPRQDQMPSPTHQWLRRPPETRRNEPRRSSPRRVHGSRHRDASLPLRPRHAVRGRGGCRQRWTLSWPWPVNSNPVCLHQRRRMVATRWWCRGPGAPQAQRDRTRCCLLEPWRP